MNNSERQRTSTPLWEGMTNVIDRRLAVDFVPHDNRNTSNQGAFTKTPELRTELRRGKNQLKKLVLLRPVRKYGFCSLGILEVFICETPSELI
jgi:hypothetical protein